MKSTLIVLLSLAVTWVQVARGESGTGAGGGVPPKEVAAILFLDLANPQCAGVERDLDAFAKAKGVTVQIVVKHAPSRSDAVEAHEALEAARAQGKFREMEDHLFQEPDTRGRGLVRLAAKVGMDSGEFEEAMDNRTFRWVVLRDMTEARGLGIRSTPTLFVDGTRLEGSEAIRSALHPPSAKPPPSWKSLAVEPLALDLQGSPSRGAADAPVTIIEFTDFRCGFCRMNSRTLAELEEAFPGRIRRVFKNYPVHQEEGALLPHLASLAALGQGKFWELHHELMNKSVDDQNDLFLRAAALGLDTNRLAVQLNDEGLRSRVVRDMNEGEQLGIQATPTTFINGRRIVGRQSLETLKGYVSNALEIAGAPRDSGEGASSYGAPGMIHPDNLALGPADGVVLLEAFIQLGPSECPDLVSRLREFSKERPGVRVEFHSCVATNDAAEIRVHEAALAAAEQGRFWEMCDQLRKESSLPDAGRLDALAEALKLDLALFHASIRGHGNQARILADSRMAEERGLLAGALMMNGTPFHGEPTVENLARHMDENACCGKAAGFKRPQYAQQVISKSSP